MYLKDDETYYLASTIELGPEDSGLTILPWPAGKTTTKGNEQKKRYVYVQFI